MNIRQVLVVGFGTMGVGIAQACSQSGYRVFIHESNAASREKGLKSIEWSLGKLAEKGLLKESVDTICANFSIADKLEIAREADLVIEAVYENLDVKQELLHRIEGIVGRHTILATNTSSLSVTEIASAVSFPDRVVGIHFFNPVHRMKLVEIVRGTMTSESTVAVAKTFVVSLNKESVLVQKDMAGFIVNRINGMAFLEALRMIERGVATVGDIDKAIRLGLGYPMGPFELMDMIGLDVVLKAREGIHAETKDPNHYPPVLLRRMVQAGLLGRKTGRGFYNYEG